jgi:adenosine deaminase
MSWYSQIPKVELHIHLEGAIPHAALFELIQKYGGDPSVPDARALAKRFKYKNFQQFIEAWSWENGYLREYDDFSYVAEQAAYELVQQNIFYAEMFFSPSLFARRGLQIQELTQAIRSGLSRISKVEIALISDFVRDYGLAAEMKTLKQLHEVKNLGVVGIGIGGSEHEFPPRPFKPLYEEARKMGFHTNAHAGEAAGAQSIWEAICYLEVERIGHGTRAMEDSDLVEYLAIHKIPLEMCPGSNVRTGVVSTLYEHPIRDFFEKGLVVTVSTDDPKMFQTNLAEEYRQLEQICGFTKSDICQLILSAVESSWLPDERKSTMVAEFKKAPGWKEK